MKNKNPLPYEAPAIEVQYVELEQGIAAASATVSGGDSDTPYQPDVTDWQDNGFEEQDESL